MWLINARTLQLQHFADIRQVGSYGILSHTWGSEEVSFQDFRSVDRTTVEQKQGFAKIRYACQQAVEDDLIYVWVDTCCFNKESSAELSEAINSMYMWYSKASECYAYLEDVTSAPTEDMSPGLTEGFTKELRASRWFKRGWTLQELIAPRNVHFYGREWQPLGTRHGVLLDEIHRITCIDREVLSRQNWVNIMQNFSIAKRMSWAARRKTTRIACWASSV